MKYGKLKNPYITVMKEGRLSYGGSQSWGKGATLRKYGCGTIAGTDVLLYLNLHKDYCSRKEIEEENGIFEAEAYMETVKKMKWRYFPLIPGFGMPGWFLAAGINRYFRIHRVPLKASFGVLGRNMWNRMHAMLSHDIPVILAIGPNFPIPGKKHKLTFYEKASGSFREVCKTAAHYVTVTAMDGQWIRISSWGREYYIDMNEYMDYVKKHSSFFVSNILYIRKRRSRREECF